jgi:hypothetical protein
MNLRFIHHNLYPLWVTLALIAAAVCWFGTSVPAWPSAKAAPSVPWQLPALAQPNGAQAAANISARNLWGNVAASAAPTKAPEWHIVGITTTATERLVLLAYEGKPVATLKVGDTLPDDTTIVQIEHDRFFVKAKGHKKIAYGIYKHEPIQQ